MKNFVLCDSDMDYTERFLGVVQERLEREFAIYAYADTQQLQELLRREEVEILLISEKLYRRFAQAGSDRVRHVFLLCEGEGLKPNEVRRYQAADGIIRCVLQRYADRVETPVCLPRTSERKLHFIGVYTPIGRCLQTTFAITLGQLLAKRHRTLYLNFEGFSGLSRIFQNASGYSMMDFVYFYDCAKEKFLYRLEHLVQTMNGLDFISPFENYQELSSIRGEKWREIFAHLEEYGAYEYVVLDLSEQMNGLLDVLRLCERIYTITRQDGFALAKMEQYEKMLHVMDYEDVLDKTSRKSFPVFRQIPAHIEQFTYGDVADYTRALLREDWSYEA